MAKQYGSNERLALGIASLQGASACYGDLPIESNPHPKGSPAFKAWNDSWTFAFQQSVKEFLDSRESLPADVELKPASKIDGRSGLMPNVCDRQWFNNVVSFVRK